MPVAAPRKIGIYGGTFDPVHHGHLILAREARENFALDKMIFVPAAQSPHKMQGTIASAALRLEMLRAAIDGEPGLAVDDCEAQREPPSYTIDTVKFLRAREPNAELFYFVGEDNIAELPTWHRFAELDKLVQFVVLSRSDYEMQPGYPIVRRLIDISATGIRNRVASGHSIRYLVPAAVEEIIRREQLYLEPKK